MRKKLLSLLVLLMTAVTGAWAETTIVTWTSSGSYENNNSRGGVTLSGEVVEYIWDELSGGEWRLAYDSEQGTFTTSLGNFTSIVISGGDIDGFSGTGWNGRTWTGNASSVPFRGYLTDVYGEEPWTITFTIAPAEPVASWVGNSAINANGTWYYAGSNFGWCTGGAFNGADLGTITTLSLGGQSQAWAEGNANWNDGNLTMTMGYKIDGGADESLSLNWFEFADNNNKFQSGGSSWAAQDIDISGLTPGNHTIAVWFTRDDKWDSNNSANYVANFTIPTPAATTYNVTLSANGNTKVVENVTLPHTFSCYYNGSIGVGDGELDLIIQELYGFSGGWCDESSPWMDNAVSGVTVGISSDNQYFSISTPFEGTAQVKGWYYRGWEDDFEYTLDIAIAAVEPEPEPEPQPAGYAVSLKAETADEGNWTAKAGEGEYQSLPLEGVAEGTQVSLKYSGLKKVKSVKAVKKASAEPAGPTTVTWDFSQLSGFAATAETPYENGGVTLSGEAYLDFDNNSLTCMGELTFTAPSGKKFTSIVITASDWIEFYGTGWSGSTWSDSDGQTTINFKGGAGGISTIVFTLVETAAAGLTSYTLAESTVGMIVGTDGKAYDVADKDNLPSGVTAAGVVVYKNGANGLAIALTDEASMMDWATACGESGAAAHTPAVSGCSWKLPSQEEWTLVKNANSGSSLNSAITNAGGTAIPTVHFDHETQTMTGQYWLSTQGAIDESARTWGINGYDEIAVGSQSLKTDNNLVRACLAW